MILGPARIALDSEKFAVRTRSRMLRRSSRALHHRPRNAWKPADPWRIPVEPARMPAEGKSLPVRHERMPADEKSLPVEFERMPAGYERMAAEAARMPAEHERQATKRAPTGRVAPRAPFR